MMNCEFIICRLISHSDIICHVILSYTENDKLIEHSSFLIRHAIFKSENL